MDVAQDALDKLLDLIGGDQDSLAELIESFLEESPLLVEQMRRAAESGDRSGLGRAAHTLKSSARDFGANQLAALCAAMEQSCRDSMPGGAATEVELIAGACDRASRDLSSRLADLKRGGQPNEHRIGDTTT
ncbi:Hpt domain-containing protein [Mesorhizobium sp. M0619]|uniref:Hpt domain-containing protein n=1 Tax=unclassified Mesorhizobium TaxID=325217 RepID=UPI003335D4CF